MLAGMMLWFDNGNVPLVEKFRKMKGYFQDKYGEVPNYCEVDPGMVEKATVIEGMLVVPKKQISRNTFMIGTKDLGDNREITSQGDATRSQSALAMREGEEK